MEVSLRQPPEPGGAAVPPTTSSRHPEVPSPLSGLWLDLRSAARSLLLSPTLSLIAVAVLALGIGATTGIFSLLDAVLLEPLPYRDAERLGVVRVDAFGRTGVPVITDSNVIDFSEGANTLDAVEVFAPMKLMMDTPTSSRLVTATAVTPGMLDLLGTAVLHGRAFEETGDAPQTGPGNVILSYELWHDHFDGDLSVVGSTIELSEQPVQVVGILPHGFRLLIRPGLREHSDLWTVRPRATERAILFRRQALVRLAKGETFERASAELNAIATRSRELDLELQPEGTATYEVLPLERSLAQEVRPALVGVFLAGVFLLLLVCANLAHLLLVRGLHRQGDWALRRALGASRWRLIRPGLAESFLLAAFGGVIGLALAWLLCRSLPLVPALDVPRLASVRIDREALLFCSLATSAAALLSGLLPSLAASRWGASWLRERTVLGSGRNSRTAVFLVAGQIAITIILLVASGALARSLGNLHDVPLGFDPENVLAFDFSVNRELREDAAARLRFNRELLEWLEARPDVEAASLTNALPFAGRRNLASYATDAVTEATFGELTASFHRVLPRYFETMGMTLVAGRDFDRTDTDNAAHVAVVGESLARSAWPDRSALGQSLLIEFAAENGTERRPAEVIGVVSDVRETDLRSTELPQVYLPYWPTSYAQDFVVRSEIPPLEMARSIDTQLRTYGEGLVVDDRKPLSSTVHEASAEIRLALLLLAGFALMALVVSCLGLYGALSYRVDRRRTEIGLRLALGATRRGILASTVLEGMGLAGLGVVVGLFVSFGALRGISAFLFGVTPNDPRTLAVVVPLLLGAAMLACLSPARSATRVSPTEALRSD